MEILCTLSKTNVLFTYYYIEHQYKFFTKHHIDYKNDHSMQTSHILCFQETRIRYAHDVDKYIDASRYKYIHNYGGYGILMLYEHHINCASFYTMNCNVSELTTASFNLGTRNAIYVIIVYRAHSTNITLFVDHLHELVHKVPLECPIIILSDFNVDISHYSTQHYENKKFFHSMNKLHHLKQQISTPTTIKNSLIDHILLEIHGIEITYRVTDAYWPDYHKPIYYAFTLFNNLPKFNLLHFLLHKVVFFNHQLLFQFVTIIGIYIFLFSSKVSLIYYYNRFYIII